MFFLTFLHAQNWCYLVFLLATTERHQRQGGNDHDCKGGRVFVFVVGPIY